MSQPTELPDKPVISAVQALSISYMIWDRICDILSRPLQDSSYQYDDTVLYGIKREAVQQLCTENKFSSELEYKLNRSYNCGCCLYVCDKVDNYGGMTKDVCVKHCPSMPIWNTYPVDGEDFFSQYDEDATCEEYVGSPYTYFNWSDTCEEAYKHAKVMADELNALIIMHIRRAL